MFNLSVDSDWHANYTSANLQATLKQNYSQIDDRICLGDVLLYRATETNENEFEYWQDELLVLGNHDMIAAASGWNWYDQPTNVEAYNRWYAPYVATNGIDIAENTLYWSKEYTDKNILLIGGYCMFNNSEDRELQYEFFRERLFYAIQHNLSVIIAYHWCFQDMQTIHCSFTNASALNTMNGHDSTMPETYGYEERLTQLVDDAKRAGLDFICWINGHRHTDEILIKDGQLHLLVGSTKYDSGNRVKRIDGTPAEALLNVVTYNERKQIEIRRYGADVKTYGGLRHLLILEKDGTVVFDWSA